MLHATLPSMAAPHECPPHQHPKETPPNILLGLQNRRERWSFSTRPPTSAVPICPGRPGRQDLAASGLGGGKSHRHFTERVVGGDVGEDRARVMGGWRRLIGWARSDGSHVSPSGSLFISFQFLRISV